MKIYYYNDTQDEMTIRVNHEFHFDPAQPELEPKMDYFKLAPQTGQVYEFAAPANSIPYVKVWSLRNVTLLTYIQCEALELLQNPTSSDT